MRTPSWKWTPQRRTAMRLTLEGLSQGQVARRVGVHRHTIQNWGKTAEWITELRRRIEERGTAARFRRLHSTERLTDKLAELAGEALEAKRIDVSRAGLLLRELRDYQRLEREHVGLDAPRNKRSPQSQPIFTEDVEPLAQGSSAGRLSDRPFREFLKEYWGHISAEALNAPTAQEALVLAVQDILSGAPEVLSQLHAEEEAAEHERAARKNAEVRRR